MSNHHDTHHLPEERPVWWKTRSVIACGLFLLAVGYVLFMEHSAHIVPYLPWTILLLCPLIHLFHHGSHSHGRSTKDPDTTNERGE